MNYLVEGPSPPAPATADPSVCPVPHSTSSRKVAPHQPQPHHLVCSCLSCPPCLPCQLPTPEAHLQNRPTARFTLLSNGHLSILKPRSPQLSREYPPLDNFPPNLISASEVRTPALAYPPKHHQTNILHPCACAFLDPTIFSPRQPSPTRCSLTCTYTF